MVSLFECRIDVTQARQDCSSMTKDKGCRFVEGSIFQLSAVSPVDINHVLESMLS